MIKETRFSHQVDGRTAIQTRTKKTRIAQLKLKQRFARHSPRSHWRFSRGSRIVFPDQARVYSLDPQFQSGECDSSNRKRNGRLFLRFEIRDNPKSHVSHVVRKDSIQSSIRASPFDREKRGGFLTQR